MIFPVIMAGGKGERFWPYSNKQHPKQLLPLVSNKSMLEDVLALVEQLKSPNPVHIIASKNLEAPMRKILKNRKNIVLIGEPQGRDTAAAIALASRLIANINPKGVMVVLTADHAISPGVKFVKAIKAAAALAAHGDSLVTFGIKPDRPETGYGYIETLKGPGRVNGLQTFKVKGFCEKPNLANARKYLKTGRYYWNSGMFAWRVDYIWSLFKMHLPKVYKSFQLLSAKAGSRAFTSQLNTIYNSLDKVSIDYGIMEHAPSIQVVVPDFSWDDIGSWSALDRRNKTDSRGNISLGDAVQLSTSNCTCFTDKGLVAAFGVKDLLIVQHNGVTLVVHKDMRPNLKDLVKEVQKHKKLDSYL